MNIEQVRFNMIEQQIRPWNVLDADVLELLKHVKRENFVPLAHKEQAFMDIQIPLPCGESMLEPKVEARILQELGLKHHESVLEIGAGSGYMAALLAFQSRHVTTVEIELELQQLAQKNLADNHVNNVKVEHGNGANGWKTETYDAIVVSGGLEQIPETLLAQLKVGGRLAAFVGRAPVMHAQIITRTAQESFETRSVFETLVKPLREAPFISHFSL